MNEQESKKSGSFDPVKAAAIIFCIFAAIAVAYAFFGHLFKVALPFLLGAAIAWIACTLSSKLSRHTRASGRTVSAAVLIALIGSMIGGLFFAIRRLISELGRLAESLASGESPISELPSHAAELADKIGQKLASFFPGSSTLNAAEITDRINAFASEMINGIVSQIGSAVPGILTSILKALPDIFLGLIVTVISAFYFTLDYARIKKKVADLLPCSVRSSLAKLKKEAAVAAFGYLRAYSLIMLITFAEIFFGLSVLGVDYSFLIAALSALIDILPVLGVGTVLIPWAIICLVTQNIFRGIGLIILYVIIVIVRQFIEPKIIGENLGMHPLLALAAFYLGYKLFGFAGIFIAPLTLIIWRAFGSYRRESEETG